MTKTKMKILIIAAVGVAMVITFNLLPSGIRIAATVSAGIGFIAGIVAKAWYDRQTKKKEGEA